MNSLKNIPSVSGADAVASAEKRAQEEAERVAVVALAEEDNEPAAKKARTEPNPKQFAVGAVAIEPVAEDNQPRVNFPEHWKEVSRHSKVVSGARIVAFKAPYPEGTCTSADEEHEFTPYMLMEYYENKGIPIGMVVSVREDDRDEPCAKIWEDPNPSPSPNPDPDPDPDPNPNANFWRTLM